MHWATQLRVFQPRPRSAGPIQPAAGSYLGVAIRLAHAVSARQRPKEEPCHSESASACSRLRRVLLPAIVAPPPPLSRGPHPTQPPSLPTLLSAQQWTDWRGG